MAERLLTVRDVSLILGISEKEVLDLAESAKLPAYKIGGVFLRFKPEQVEEFRKSPQLVLLRKPDMPEQYSFWDRLNDFLYFNDFYIVSILIISLILIIIFRGY